jgi:hypothetical protein
MRDPGAPWGQKWIRGAGHRTSDRPPNGEAVSTPSRGAEPELPSLPIADEADEVFFVDCEVTGVLLEDVKVSDGDSELTRGRVTIRVRAKTLAGAIESASELRPEDVLRIRLRPVAAWQMGEQPVATKTENE